MPTPMSPDTAAWAYQQLLAGACFRVGSEAGADRLHAALLNYGIPATVLYDRARSTWIVGLAD